MVGRSIIQRLVEGDLEPDRTMLPAASDMRTWSAVYVAVSPASQSAPIDSREPVRSGKRCTVRAAGGVLGWQSVPRGDDRIEDPSGRVTVTLLSL